GLAEGAGTLSLDRVVPLGLHHAVRGDRSARLRADLRRPHARSVRGGKARNGDPRLPDRGTILLIFALFGERLLAALHIELDAFRTAGGIMLFLIALDMVFEKRTGRREARAEKVRETPEIEDVSVFPMALPMLDGPGAIASIMLLTSSASGLSQAR